jgi:hypothetical protein
MDEKIVETLAADIAHRIANARKHLFEEMAALGLTPDSGWRITEELRHTVEGTQWVFRPVHLREPSPDLQATVAIDHSGRPV